MTELKELWKNPKYRALLRILLWAIFFVFIYSLIIVSNNRVIKKNNDSSVNEEIYKKLLNLSFNTLKVSYDLNEYYVEGIVQNNIFTGVIYYSDGTTYKIEYDGYGIKKIKEDNTIQEDYIIINVDSQYLLPYYLTNLFKDNLPKKIDNNLYSYKINDIEYVVKYNDKEIYEININKDGKTSKLEYSVID